MPRDHRPSDPLPFDPLSGRSLAMACALIGLATILLSERPTAGGVLLAWAGFVGWAVLRLFGGRAPQPVRRKIRARPRPIIEVVEVADWAPRRPAPVLALPKPIAVGPPEAVDAWATPAHPAVLAGVRRRREEG